MHYVVVEKNNKKTYNGGNGYQERSVLHKLGFPPAPYSRAGANTLARQAATLRPGLKFEVVEFKEA